MDAAQIAELTALAAARYPDGFEQPSEQLFALLVDVADAYIAALGAEHLHSVACSNSAGCTAARPRSRAADIEMTCAGLEENLEERLYVEGRS